MYCPECGSKNEDDATFCTNCGAYIDNTSYDQPYYQDKKSPKSYKNTGIALIVTILLVTAGLFGFAYIFVLDGDPFVADDYVLYGDGAVGSGIITAVNDHSDIDPLDDISIVTLTFKKSIPVKSWGIRSLDQSLYYVDENTPPPSSEFYYYDERKYEIPDGATFSEDGKSMTCSLIPGHYSVSVFTNFKDYIGSFVVGGEVTRNYEWSYNIPDGPDDSFELSFSFQYSECVSAIAYDGLRGYIDYDKLSSTFKTYTKDGIIVTEDLQSKLQTLYANSVFSVYVDDYYYASFILAFVQQVISYYPEDLSGDVMPGSAMGADERIYGREEYWAFPTETLIQGAGDCEDTSFLCAALFRAAELDAALLILPGHMMAGIYLENGISSVNYPHYTESSEYIISEEIVNSKTGTTKTYYGCETTADSQYLIGYTNLKDEVKGVEYELVDWVPPGIYSTNPKTFGFYPV